MGKSCPPLLPRSGVSRLMVTPRVSGLERSQEKSLEPHFPEHVSSSTSSASFSRLPSHSPVTTSGPVPRPSPMNGNSGRHNGSPPLSKPKPFLTLPGRSHTIYNINRFVDECCVCECFWSTGRHSYSYLFFFLLRSSTPVKPSLSGSSVASSASALRPPTPSTSVSLPYIRGAGPSGPLRPHSQANSRALFTSSPGLPPPPPLLQGPSHSTGTVHRNFSPLL